MAPDFSSARILIVDDEEDILVAAPIHPIRKSISFHPPNVVVVNRQCR